MNPYQCCILQAVALCLVAALSRAATVGHPPALQAEANAAIQAIADKIADGKMDEAKVAARKLFEHRDDLLYEAMASLKPRDKGGFGVGPKPGHVSPDGIERKLAVLARNGLAGLKVEAGALEQMGHRVAAIALVTKAYKPRKNQVLWRITAEKMFDLSLEFVKVVKSGDAHKVQLAAARLNNNCNQCHQRGREFTLPDLQKIAEALRKGDQATAKLLTELMSKRENVLLHSMKTLQPGDKDYPSFGVGKLHTFNPAEGIQTKIQDLARVGIGRLEVVPQQPALLELGYRVKAVAQLTLHVSPKPGQELGNLLGVLIRTAWPEKGKELWNNLAKEFDAASKEFIVAVKGFKFRDVRRSAARMEASCIRCHQQFR